MFGCHANTFNRDRAQQESHFTNANGSLPQLAEMSQLWANRDQEIRSGSAPITIGSDHLTPALAMIRTFGTDVLSPWSAVMFETSPVRTTFIQVQKHQKICEHVIWNLNTAAEQVTRFLQICMRFWSNRIILTTHAAHADPHDTPRLNWTSTWRRTTETITNITNGSKKDNEKEVAG